MSAVSAQAFIHSRFRCVPVLLLAATLLTGCGPVLGTAELYRRATHAANNADFEQALALTDKALQQDPDHVQALVLHGYVRYRLMTPEQLVADPSPVLTHVEKAARLAPDDFIAQYFCGWMLFEAELYGRALEPLERAYALREQCPEQHDNLLVLLSMCCVQQNLVRGRGYLQALRRFGGFERSVLLYNALGVLNAKQLDYGNALAAFKDALQRDPSHPVVLQNLAVLHDDRLRRPDEAIQYYVRAIAARQAMRDTSRQDIIRNRLRQLAAERRRPAGR